MAINISFGGATIQRPGSYSTVDTTSMTAVTAGGFKTLAMVGVPNASNTCTVGSVSDFNDPILAAAALGQCEALELMKIMWAHGADLIEFSPVAQSATDTDWQSAIDCLQSASIDGIVVASNSVSINAKAFAHCTLMSSVLNKRERWAFVGHAAGLTVSAIAALQAAFASELVVLATPEVYNYDSTGASVLCGSEYLAAAYAGTWAGQEPEVPITYKYVSFPGLGKIYNGTDINTLLAAHIAPTEYVRNKGYRIVQGVTTSASADLTECELSVSTTKVYMNQTIREYMDDKFVGQAGVVGIETTMYNDLVTLIEGFKTAKYISGYDSATVSVVKNGTAFILQWEGYPTLPINNFLLTTHLTL